ncbi:hypothetical protein G6F58_010462 [Rhizopus delemar]|nr:hypothetical protein G6F58_010462 [Rhizopus delemar]
MQSTHFFETPKFSGKEDPNLWIFRFEKTAKLNNWSDDIKLQYVDNCFNEDLQLWCMEKNFAVWSDFKSAFLDKYTKRVDSDKIISSIINFKMQPSESVTKYITRFEKLVLELRKNKLVKFNIEDAKYDTGETKDEPKIKGKSKLMELKEDKQELHITETGLIKYFIKGIPSRSIRTLLKAEKPTTLTMLYASLRDMSESDNESEASDSDTEQIATKLTKTENKSLKNDSIPTTQAEPNAINNLIDKFQNMTLLIGELMERVEPVKTKRKSACYNCQSNDHYSRDCTAPCKFCNSSGHKHYECPKHPKNNPATNNQNGESFMIEEEEHYMAEKRKLVDINPTIESPRNKRKGRTTKPAPVYESKPLPTIANTPKPIYLNNASDTVMQEPTSHANPIPIQVKTQSQPEHPLLPLKDKSQIEEIARKKAEEIIHNIISEKVHKVSLLDIAEISPVARTGIKSSITKPRIRNPKAPIKVVDVKPSTISAEGLNLMLGEVEYQQPKGRSAPRTKGVINGRPCEIILDGGCTSYIISLEFARKIGISQLEPIAASVMFGDGGSRQPIGLARNVHIELSGKVNICVHALCFDVKDSYQFIIGRDGFFALGVGTDWRTHFWYLRTDNGNIPIDVYYTKNGVKEYNSNRVVPTLAEENEDSDSDYQYDDEDFVDQDESEEGFLIIEDYDSYSQPTTQENLSESNQGRLGNLLDRIRSQNNISTKEKQDLCDTILEFQDCFGTNYNHLGTTNLLKFHVDTGDAKPIYKRPYNFLSYSEKETLKSDLAEMVNNGILIPNTHVPGNSKQAGWSFPCRYVPKKTGDKRLVTNFQDLNAVTVRDTWPLPSVVDVLEHLAGAQWFSVCDLLKAFQQIAVEEESIPKLTIATPWGTYSYRYSPPIF